MSFHGGLIGSFLAGYIYIKRKKLRFFSVADLIIPTCPPGLMFGRFGNFINGELFGKPSDVPWAMIFPQGGNIPRHPSQLYEAFFEGIVLFAFLWLIRRRRPFEGSLLALYIVGYGLVRFFIEFFREPDAHLGFVFGALSMGQLLCLLMILAGAGLYFYRMYQLKNA